jgi:hypothetical protein
MELRKKSRSRNGKLVNIGNADSDGATVNNWNPRNSNGHVGFFLSRSVAEKRP